MSRREWRPALSGLGSTAALALMVLRETGSFDKGYLPPYVVFAVAILLAHPLPGA